MSKPRCPARTRDGHRKRAYRSEGSALRAASDFAKQYGEAMRAYECPRCPSWHLTKAVR